MDPAHQETAELDGVESRHQLQQPELRNPEDFTVPPGELSRVACCSVQQQPFRCQGCTRQECQVSVQQAARDSATPAAHCACQQGELGCQPMSWRLQSGGYLAKILTATVYDVAVRP